MDTQVDSDMQSANISDFAQWVQQERFPLFVKVSFHLPFFRDIFGTLQQRQTLIRLLQILGYSRKIQSSSLHTQAFGNGCS